MEKSGRRSLTEQIWRAFRLEGGKWFYKLRYLACAVFAVLLAIALLPQEACELLAGRFVYVTAFVNVGLAFILVCGLLFLPEVLLAQAYTQRGQPTQKDEGISQKAYLLARLLLCIVIMAVLLFTTYAACSLMERFATDTVRWFSIDFAFGFQKQLIAGALVQPLLFLWFFLKPLAIRQERQYLRAYLVSVVIFQIVQAVAGLSYVHFAPGKEPPGWVLDGFWYLVMLGFAAVMFRRVTGRLRAAFQY